MEAEFEALKDLLTEKNVKFHAYSHEKIITAEEAARIRDVPLGSGVKAMIVKASNGFFLVLISGDRKIDFEKLKGKIGKSKLASQEDVFRVTGCEVGSVHPFGSLFGLPVLMDQHILDNDTVHFSAGTHEASISMSPKDMVKVIEPEISDFSKG